MADELIRYSRIKSFILEPQSYLSFNTLGYNLRDDEIIMIQSMLTKEYFEGLVPAIINKYVKYNSYDEAMPIQHLNYVNEYTLEEAYNPEKAVDCISSINSKVSSLIWRKIFPNNTQERDYGKTLYCTFEVIINLIYEKTSKKMTISQIRNELFEQNGLGWKII